MAEDVKILMLKGDKGDAGVSGDYSTIDNKPSINGVELDGNKSLDALDIASRTALSAEIASRSEGDNALQVEIDVLESKTSSLGTRMTTAETDINVLDARMDTFASLPAGSTSGNAELVDIRVGADGTTYPTAGDAVRGQVTDLKSDLNKLILFDDYQTTSGKFIKWADGTFGEYSPLKASSLIDVHLAKYVKIVNNEDTAQDQRGCAFYDKYKNFVSGVQYDRSGVYVITVPTDAWYFAFTISSTTDSFYIYNTNEYKNDEFFAVSYTRNSGKYIKWIDGKLGDYAPLSYTSKINIEGFAKIYLQLSDDSATDARGCAFYDKDHLFISGVQYNRSYNYLIAIPDNACYFACTLTNSSDVITVYAKSNSEKAVTASEYNPCKYFGESISVFNNGLCIGDSLTKGVFNQNVDPSADTYMEIQKYSYPTILSKMIGVPLTNMGNSGITTKDWYLLHQSDDLSGYDFAIINLGVNDTTEKGTTVAESGQYLGYIISKLQNENQKIKIFIANILPNYYSTNEEWYAQINETRETAVSNYSNCYLVDLTEFSACKANTPYSQGHLTAIGYAKEASELKSYISYIIDSNLSAFMDVQFSNTDYGYNS